jgi:hypothetical protein
MGFSVDLKPSCICHTRGPLCKTQYKMICNAMVRLAADPVLTGKSEGWAASLAVLSYPVNKSLGYSVDVMVHYML